MIDILNQARHCLLNQKSTIINQAEIFFFFKQTCLGASGGVPAYGRGRGTVGSDGENGYFVLELDG